MYVVGQPELLRLSQVDDAYAGQVLTFTAGPAAPRRQHAHRRLHVPAAGYSDPNNPSPTFTVMAFPLADGTPVYDPSNNQSGPALLNGSRILVNGRPFNGTGVGFDPSPLSFRPADYEGPRSDAKEFVLPNQGPTNDPGYEIALLPNPVFFNPTDDLDEDRPRRSRRRRPVLRATFR